VAWLWAAAALAWGLASTSGTVSSQTGAAGSDPKALVNPSAGKPGAVAAGKTLYEQHCLECHGEAGAGDGMAGEGMKPPPADLTDALWRYGSTDGEIFTIVRTGSRDGMKAFKDKLKDGEIWDVVTYVRTLAKKPRP
jgi:putative ABC transport system permease protein